MIYDCFTFFNELDLLEIRLNTLKDVVDCFVIAEATRTYRGKPKELYFEKNRKRYANFLDRIRYIVVDDLLPEEVVEKDAYNLPWVNENRQRNALARGLSGAGEDDVVMVSDLDEIPRPSYVVLANERLKDAAESVRFEMGFYNFYINFKNYSYPRWSLGTIATKYGSFLQGRLLSGVRNDRYTQASENVGSTIQKLRFLKSANVLKNAGWHFSFLGGIDAIQKKLAAFSHSEFSVVSREVLEDRLSKGQDLFGRAGQSFGVPLDSSFPEFVLQNRFRFAKLVFPVDDNYLRRTQVARKMASFRGAMYRLVVWLVPDFAAPMLVRFRDKVMKMLGRI